MVVVNTSMPKHLKHILAISHFFCWADAFLLFLNFFPCLFRTKGISFYSFFFKGKQESYIQISNFIQVNALLHSEVNCLKVLGGEGVGKPGEA